MFLDLNMLGSIHFLPSLLNSWVDFLSTFHYYPILYLATSRNKTIILDLLAPLVLCWNQLLFCRVVIRPQCLRLFSHGWLYYSLIFVFLVSMITPLFFLNPLLSTLGYRTPCRTPSSVYYIWQRSTKYFKSGMNASLIWVTGLTEESLQMPWCVQKSMCKV